MIPLLIGLAGGAFLAMRLSGSRTTMPNVRPGPINPTSSSTLLLIAAVVTAAVLLRRRA